MKIKGLAYRGLDKKIHIDLVLVILNRVILLKKDLCVL